MPYLLPWGILLAAGLGALLGIYGLTRPIKNAFIKRSLRCLAMVWLLLPAPIPLYPGYFAPAFVVAIFEAFLQRDGAPEQAVYILAFGTLLVLSVLVYLGLQGRRQRNNLTPEDAGVTAREPKVGAG